MENKTGCSKIICMDCGAKRKMGTDYFHNEGCTMGDTGWMPCGEKYDGDLILCEKCKELNFLETIQDLSNKTTAKKAYQDYLDDLRIEIDARLTQLTGGKNE